MTLRRLALTAGAAGALVLAIPGLAVAAGELRPPLGSSPSDSSLGDLFAMAEKGDIAPLCQASQWVENPAVAALIRARLAASALDTAVVRQALDDYGRMGDADGFRQGEALGIAAEADFAAGDYAAAAGAIRRRLALASAGEPPQGKAGLGDLASIADPLSSAPAQAVLGGAANRIMTVRDPSGLLRAPVRLNGLTQEAVLDTGANVSVVSTSTARAIHLRILGEGGSIGSSTRNAVQTRIGMADRLEIAGVTLTNVAFLILDDAQLRLPPPSGYQIGAILGFPVFRALGAVTFGADGSFTANPDAPIDAQGPHNLLASGNNLFVEAAVNGMAVPLLLDTGSSTTSLSAGFARDHPAILGGVARRSARIGSAGGAIDQQVATLKGASVSLSGRTVTLAGLDVVLSDNSRAESQEYGAVGQDVLSQLGGYTIDIRNMRLRVPGP